VAAIHANDRNPPGAVDQDRNQAPEAVVALDAAERT